MDSNRKFSDDEAFELVLAHWHRGVDLLVKEFADAGDVDKFIIALAQKAAESATRLEFASPQPFGSKSAAFPGRVPGRVGGRAWAARRSRPASLPPADSTATRL